MTSPLVYASGSRPDRCARGHPWGPGAFILSWVTCDCEGAKSNPGGYGHHRIRCAAGPGCPSVWQDPPCWYAGMRKSPGHPEG